MKTKLLLATTLAALFIFGSCSKDDDNTFNPVGEWKYDSYLIEDGDDRLTPQEFDNKYSDTFRWSGPENSIDEHSDITDIKKSILTFTKDGKIKIEEYNNDEYWSETFQWESISSNQIRLISGNHSLILDIEDNKIIFPDEIYFYTTEGIERVFKLLCFYELY